MSGSLQVARPVAQSSLLQSVHRIWPRSGKKPEPTSETEQREHLKHGWCHCRSSKEMYLPSPNPAETQHRRQPLSHGIILPLSLSKPQQRFLSVESHHQALPGRKGTASPGLRATGRTGFRLRRQHDRSERPRGRAQTKPRRRDSVCFFFFFLMESRLWKMKRGAAAAMEKSDSRGEEEREETAEASGVKYFL